MSDAMTRAYNTKKMAVQKPKPVEGEEVKVSEGVPMANVKGEKEKTV